MSRRRVVQGAAWAVPAVVVASAAPSSASSPGIITVDNTRSCKLPGESFGADFKYGYYFTYCVNNPSNSQQMSGTVTWDNAFLGTQTFNIAPGGSQCFEQYVFSTNSANITATATITYTIGSGAPVTDTQTLSIGGFDPCCTGPHFCPDGCTQQVCPPPGFPIP